MAQQTTPTNSSDSQFTGQSIGIVGAGLMGRLLAWKLSKIGYEVTLFERDDSSSANSCGYAGAGMLAPVAELESSEPMIARLGFDSLALWKSIIASLELPVFFRQLGTLVVAHPLDMPELQRFARMLQSKVAQLPSDIFPPDARNAIQWELNRAQLQAIEPQLGSRFQTGIFLPEEGQIDNRHLLTALAHGLKRQGVTWICNTTVQRVQAHLIDDGQASWQFTWVIDCRGLGARPDWQAVRGVRGEIVRVHAPEVILDRPVRLMHPRHPIYIVPRENRHYLIGATSIESDDRRPMTVQSALELLSTAFTVHPGFAEASIVELIVNSRPALPDNLPTIQVREGLIRMNGLYRHGFLISPKLAELVCDYIGQDMINPLYEELFDTASPPQGIMEETRHAIAH